MVMRTDLNRTIAGIQDAQRYGQSLGVDALAAVNHHRAGREVAALRHDLVALRECLQKYPVVAGIDIQDSSDDS